MQVVVVFGVWSGKRVIKRSSLRNISLNKQALPLSTILLLGLFNIFLFALHEVAWTLAFIHTNSLLV